MVNIYIIKNTINNKWYVGKTNRELNIRFREHISDYNNRFDLNRKLHLSIRKYGIENFEIQLYKTVCEKSWREEEKKAIREMGGYLSSNSLNSSEGGEGFSHGEDHILSKFTNQEVYEIRKRRFEGESKKDVYLDYNKNSTFSAFESIWLGFGYHSVGEEFKINKNKSELISQSNRGSKNGRAKLTEETVLEIRTKKSQNIPKHVVYKDYKHIPNSTFNKVWNYYTWKHVTLD